MTPGSASARPTTPAAVIAMTAIIADDNPGQEPPTPGAKGGAGRGKAQRHRPRAAGQRQAGQDEAGQLLHAKNEHGRLNERRGGAASCAIVRAGGRRLDPDRAAVTGLRAGRGLLSLSSGPRRSGPLVNLYEVRLTRRCVIERSIRVLATPFRSVFERHTGMRRRSYRDRFAQMTFDRGKLADGRSAAATRPGCQAWPFG